jgi:hypothetical protein
VNRVKLMGIVVAAVVLPVALVLSALAISRGVEASPVVPGLDPSSTESADDRSGPGSGSRDEATPSPSPSIDDLSGPCDEAEHADDPECITGSGDGSGSDFGSGDGDGDDDSSGPGGGSGSGSGSDDSGPSDSSGSSGSGGSGSNSGPGGGDD